MIKLIIIVVSTIEKLTNNCSCFKFEIVKYGSSDEKSGEGKKEDNLNKIKY